MFTNYREAEPNVFMELTGIAFEEFAVGQVFEHRPGRTITEEECRKHMMHALDLSPRYLDREYAVAVHGRYLVPEPFLLSIVAILTTKTFGRVVANLGWTNTVMHGQAAAGDTITAESEILGKRESNSRPDQGIMHVATRGYNQAGALLCSYERRFLIYRGDGGPYRKAGY